MIEDRFRSRFVGDSGVDIGVQAIDAVLPSGERFRVLLRLGAPFLRDNLALVRAELEHLDRTDGPIAGGGTLDAIAAGLRFIVARLKIYSDRHGVRYYWPDSNDPYMYEDVLCVDRLSGGNTGGLDG